MDFHVCFERSALMKTGVANAAYVWPAICYELDLKLDFAHGCVCSHLLPV
jgi:hypothetical protein